MGSLSAKNASKKFSRLGTFKGLSQHWERVEFSKNLRASPFNDDLENEPNFGRIHLAGQYL
jgi:hypothetical protein